MNDVDVTADVTVHAGYEICPIKVSLLDSLQCYIGEPFMIKK